MLPKQLFFIFLLNIIFTELDAQDTSRDASMELSGYISTDVIYDFNQVDPDWYDVLRPTKLPSYHDQFGTDGNLYFSVRQTRLDLRNYFKTNAGELKTFIEFDLFGTGADAGQTTFHLRHAYAQLGKFGAGQTFSPFMDPDIFPLRLDVYEPCGLFNFRNIQVRWVPLQGKQQLVFALEKPGGSADEGHYANRVELKSVLPKFQLPDLSAGYQINHSWGYLRVAGLLRYLKWEDTATAPIDLSGHTVAWGLNMSSKINLNKNTTAKLLYGYGAGIENHLNDAPADIAVKQNFNDPNKPLTGKALPAMNLVLALEHTLNKHFNGSIDYSFVHIQNTDGQSADAFHLGQTAALVLVYHPVPRVAAGFQAEWGSRRNNADGWSVSDFRIRFNFKFNFSELFYRQKNK